LIAKYEELKKSGGGGKALKIEKVKNKMERMETRGTKKREAESSLSLSSIYSSSEIVYKKTGEVDEVEDEDFDVDSLLSFDFAKLVVRSSVCRNKKKLPRRLCNRV
jgi:hypothetical protein